MSHRSWEVAACLAIVGAGSSAGAAGDRFQAGLLVGVSVADGEPANDIPGFGAQVRYALSDQWAVGASLGHTEYDFETPASIVGIAQDPSTEPLDALATATSLTAFAERISFRRWRNHLVRGIRIGRGVRRCSGRERTHGGRGPVRYPYRRGYGNPAEWARRRAPQFRRDLVRGIPPARDPAFRGLAGRRSSQRCPRVHRRLSFTRRTPGSRCSLVASLQRPFDAQRRQQPGPELILYLDELLVVPTSSTSTSMQH